MKAKFSLLVCALCLLARALASAGDATPVATAAVVSPPPVADIERNWQALWKHLGKGDRKGAVQYMHSSWARDFLNRDQTDRFLKDFAQQMPFCHIQADPVPFGAEAFIYSLKCQKGEETAEEHVILRRDFDGVWRFQF